MTTTYSAEGGRQVYTSATSLGSVSVTLGDLGFGEQIVNITNDDTSIDFLSYPFWALGFWDSGTDSLSDTTMSPLDMYSPSIVPTEDGFTITWANATGDSVVVVGTFEHAFLTCDLKLRVSLGATKTAADLCVYTTLFGFKVASSTDHVLMFPRIHDMQVVKNPYGMTLLTAAHPAGGAFLDGYYNLAPQPYMHLYNTRDNSGLIIRARDFTGVTKFFQAYGSGTATVFHVLTPPSNNKSTAGAGYASQYDLTLRPMVDDWYGAARRHQHLLRTEGHPGLERGRIRDATDYSYRTRNCRFVIGYLSQDDGDGWGILLTDVVRMIDYYGTSDFVVFIYDWQADDAADDDMHPDWFPPKDDLNSVLASISALGVTPIIYTLPGLVNKDSAAYAANPSWEDFCMVDSAGNLIEIELSSGSGVYALNPEHVGGAAAIRQTMSQVFTYLSNAGGWYWDAKPGVLRNNDHNTTLAARQRGEGGSGSTIAWRGLLADMRDLARRRDATYTTWGEWMHDAFVPLLDAVRLDGWGYDTVTADGIPYVPSVVTTWGPYLRFWSNAAAWGEIGSVENTPFFAWVQAFNFHQHLITGPPRFISRDTNAVIIPKPGEADYDRWEYEEPLHAWAKSLFVDPFEFLQPFFEGQRLRPLPGSMEDDIVARGKLEFLPQLDGYLPIPDAPAVMSSVWHDDVARKVAVLLTNWTEEAVSCDVSMSVKDYPMLAGAFPIYQVIDQTTGDLTKVGMAEDGWATTIAVPARTLYVYVISGVYEPGTVEPSKPINTGATGFSLLAEDGAQVLQETNYRLTIDRQSIVTLLQEDGFGITQEDGGLLLVQEGTVADASDPPVIPPSNTAPVASTPVISGTAQVGETLTASYTYTDADGDIEGASVYGWLRDGALIASGTTTAAAGSTLVLVEADEGAIITFGLVPIALTGVAQGAVVTTTAGPVAAASGSAPVASSVTITGTEQVGFTLTASYSYTDADGDLEGSSPYTWARDAVTVASGTTTATAGSSYVLSAADAGSVMTFEVTPTSATGLPAAGTAASDSTGAIASTVNDPPTLTGVTISGTPTAGQVLTATAVGYAQAQSIPAGQHVYQWQESADNSTWSAISSATLATLPLTSELVADYVRCQVTPVAVSGNYAASAATYSSSAVGPIAAAPTTGSYTDFWPTSSSPTTGWGGEARPRCTSPVSAVRGPHPHGYTSYLQMLIDEPDLNLTGTTEVQRHINRFSDWTPAIGGSFGASALDPSSAISTAIVHALAAVGAIATPTTADCVAKAEAYIALFDPAKELQGSTREDWQDPADPLGAIEITRQAASNWPSSGVTYGYRSQQTLAILYGHLRDELSAASRTRAEEHALWWMAENFKWRAEWSTSSILVSTAPNWQHYWDSPAYRGSHCAGVIWLLAEFYDPTSSTWRGYADFYGDLLYNKFLPWMRFIMLGENGREADDLAAYPAND